MKGIFYCLIFLFLLNICKAEESNIKEMEDFMKGAPASRNDPDKGIFKEIDCNIKLAFSINIKSINGIEFDPKGQTGDVANANDPRLKVPSDTQMDIICQNGSFPLDSNGKGINTNTIKATCKAGIITANHTKKAPFCVKGCLKDVLLKSNFDVSNTLILPNTQETVYCKNSPPDIFVLAKTLTITNEDSNYYDLNSVGKVTASESKKGLIVKCIYDPVSYTSYINMGGAECLRKNSICKAKDNVGNDIEFRTGFYSLNRDAICKAGKRPELYGNFSPITIATD